MTLNTGQMLGEVFIREGHTVDSRGFPIDPKARYEYETTDENGERTTVFWRVGLSKPNDNG